MDWHVETTAIAEDDIEEIYQYIATVLGEPGIAWKQIERIRDKIGKLSYMPERNPIIQEEPWRFREIRRVNIDNYAAFYVLDNKTATVAVIRVLYARRDFGNITWED
jgi:plasmid stabilization system protein ParE